MDGYVEGKLDGPADGCSLPDIDGLGEGPIEGKLLDGCSDGTSELCVGTLLAVGVGPLLGALDGKLEGFSEGMNEGLPEGCIDGTSDGDSLRLDVGRTEGLDDCDGIFDGATLGNVNGAMGARVPGASSPSDPLKTTGNRSSVVILICCCIVDC